LVKEHGGDGELHRACQTSRHLVHNKDKSRFPIPLSISGMELDVSSIFSGHPTLAHVSSCDWKVYPREILFESMNEKRIGPITRALIDHTADKLFNYSSTMTRNMF
ncbi:hypothetical protein LTR87_018011, partial [Friedmanniomyces endolithicus]